LVRRVASRLIEAAQKMPELAGSQLPSLSSTDVYVVESPVANAFVLPGGQMFVMTGMLAPSQDTNGLATVLAHELAHAILDHAGERLALATILSYGAFFLGALTGGDALVRTLTQLFLQLGIMLPQSRRTEAEADAIGLSLMATACFDPSAAISFWQRMQSDAQNASTPLPFLSTHPAHLARADALRQLLPQAESRRMDADCFATRTFFHDFASRFS
jgi:metalloendopeptidase OMA1, mitochondrial